MVGAWGWLEWRVRLECGGCAIPNRFVRVILTGGACPAVLRRRLLKDGELPAAEMDCGHAEALRLAGQWDAYSPNPWSMACSKLWRGPRTHSATSSWRCACVVPGMHQRDPFQWLERNAPHRARRLPMAGQRRLPDQQPNAIARGTSQAGLGGCAARFRRPLRGLWLHAGGLGYRYRWCGWPWLQAKERPQPTYTADQVFVHHQAARDGTADNQCGFKSPS